MPVPGGGVAIPSKGGKARRVTAHGLRVIGLVTRKTRPSFPRRFPIHVTLRIRRDLPNLRRDRCFDDEWSALVVARPKTWLLSREVPFS